MRADVFLAGAVAIVNHNFGALLIMTFHSRGARAKLRGGFDFSLIHLQHYSAKYNK